MAERDGRPGAGPAPGGASADGRSHGRGDRRGDGRRPTMKDVATLAGVSLATVSRVVNGDPGRPDLARRVQAAVDMLGYERDLTASTLRRADRASASVGLLVSDVSNPFFAAVIRGVEDVARARGSVTVVASSDERPDRERELATALAARRVDGLMIVPTGEDNGYLARRGPLVFIDRPPRFLDADAVLSDNAGGTSAAVTHLLAHGHRRIAFLGDRSTLHTATERLAGYHAALPGAADPALVHLDLSTSDAATAAVESLLDLPEPPTALIAAQNLITIGAVRALRRRGCQHEVALVGFDDIPLADLLDPGVTVIAQDPFQLGRRAAELLFARVDGETGPTRTITVGTTLIERGSGEISPSGPS